MLHKGSVLGKSEGAALVKAIAILNEIRRSESGTVIYDHLKPLLDHSLAEQTRIEAGYQGLLSIVLDAISEGVGASSPAFMMQVKLLQLRLQPPLSALEIEALSQKMSQLIRQSLAYHPAHPLAESTTESQRVSQSDFAVHGHEKAPDRDGPHQPLGQDIASAETAKAPQIEAVYRQHLNQRTHEITKIRDTLARHVDEAIAQNEEFGVLLGVELEALRDAEQIPDVERRRSTMITELNKFIRKHRTLSDKFDSASKYLKLVESNNQQLSDELDRVRLLSMTDELTALPNRRAFLRRLEDEVGRVKRYGFPISMTLIDIDGFKSINDRLGHGGGDAMLRCYADQVLSIFRHHDMVSRYGGEEFAVVLPNTTKDGALRALQKVQKRVSECSCVYNGQRFDVPTFSAGLAEYRHGETLSEFIERTDAALYRAKRMGRNRVEIARDAGETASDADDMKARG